MNSVELKDGIIYLAQVGDQTRETMNELTRKSQKLTSGLNPVLISVDMTKNGKTDLGARQSAVETAKNLKFDRMAFFGASAYQKAVVNLILKATGQNPRVQFFATASEAEEWLRQP